MFEEEYGNATPVQDKFAYLVTGTVEISEYMGGSNTYEKSHIVYALDERDAENKFEEYYKKKTSEYSRYYYTYNVEANETLF